MEIAKQKLKGGSLSGTYLITEGNNKFVRKEVSLSVNREYGFQRWYSQLKRMQRYSVLFPGLFPEILKYGMLGDMAYFDMEYIEDSVTAHEFLITENDRSKIELFSYKLFSAMDRMHNEIISSCSEAMELYFDQEVKQRLDDCLSNENFTRFLNYETIIFNGEEIPSFNSQAAEFKKELLIYKYPAENFTHGNLTLENILYVPSQNRIVFIDPYEENIIDSRLADYSQLFQSCKSKYELLNDYTAFVINDNCVDAHVKSYIGLDTFYGHLKLHLAGRLGPGNYSTIVLLEISQYIRMLPFKMAVDESKMILFYSLASKLFSDFKKQK